MRKPLTVMELFIECKKQIENGNGNKHVFMYDDDEGNGVHGCRYSFDDDKQNLEFFENDLITRGNCEIENSILLG